MPRANPARRDDDSLLHAVAGVATLCILLGGAWLLEAVPLGATGEPGSERIQLHLTPAQPRVPPVPSPDLAQALPPVPEAARSARPLPSDAAAQDRAAPGLPAPAADASASLYDAQGRPRIPPGALPQSPTTFNERDPLRRHNPVDYRQTRFEQDWASDGELGEDAARQFARAQRKAAELVFGKDIQHARARPAPEVRFNPARHERPEDLGSEATGDAWKAAPISYEPAPGLAGEASRRIRAEVAALERDHAACPATRLQALAAPVREQLQALQQAESAHARGGDPIRAAHQLPAAANAAWDQARRALWYARQQLSDCRR